MCSEELPPVVNVRQFYLVSQVLDDSSFSLVERDAVFSGGQRILFPPHEPMLFNRRFVLEVCRPKSA